jgi:hypothetical protein
MGLGCGIRMGVIDATSRMLGGFLAVFRNRAANQAGVQRHIRQHMTTRPAIIMTAVPFASRADRERELSVISRL